MALSPDQLRTLLVNAGFKKDSQTVNDMVGIAYAESGGNPNAHNSKPPDDSYGLWQINMIGKLGAPRRKQFGITSNAQLLDPATNAKAAYIVFKSQGLDAWSTYKNGEYLKHMDGMTTGEGGNVNPLPAVTGGIKDQFSGIASAIDSVGKNLFKGLADVIGVAIALVLLAIGVIILLMQSKAGKSVVNTVKDKVPL
jgi:hypothetical protein